MRVQIAKGVPGQRDSLAQKHRRLLVVLGSFASSSAAIWQILNQSSGGRSRAVRKLVPTHLVPRTEHLSPPTITAVLDRVGWFCEQSGAERSCVSLAVYFLHFRPIDGAFRQAATVLLAFLPFMPLPTSASGCRPPAQITTSFPVIIPGLIFSCSHLPMQRKHVVLGEFAQLLPCMLWLPNVSQLLWVLQSFVKIGRENVVSRLKYPKSFSRDPGPAPAVQKAFLFPTPLVVMGAVPGKVIHDSIPGPKSLGDPVTCIPPSSRMEVLCHVEAPSLPTLVLPQALLCQWSCRRRSFLRARGDAARRGMTSFRRLRKAHKPVVWYSSSLSSSETSWAVCNEVTSRVLLRLSEKDCLQDSRKNKNRRKDTGIKTKLPCFHPFMLCHAMLDSRSHHDSSQVFFFFSRHAMQCFTPITIHAKLSSLPCHPMLCHASLPL
ncbi:uncharacterized protein MYCFIDRAFT_180745 [Pseudocercospora fijiensis CIRAD86]|uniref:Uncharacterized protein n=1 Tax=Pseudocercospora fijiensis (strain CIRAD86) TaxID=383855 RepID=M2ZCE9_PSEFD|nr:uncharacterized protein MYCFIDRAFT_180745 [Pseudocercospora fijiensis CIRAD86]EME76759.1 hypothetical protein MYCFIDRAFT_180745 [Pseudocercospora fijiensis CIRAD86]